MAASSSLCDAGYRTHGHGHGHCRFSICEKRGNGQDFSDMADRKTVAAAGAVTAAGVLPWGGIAAAALLTGLVFAWGAGRWLTDRLGGLTGDTYGAIETLTETVVLLVFSWPPGWLEGFMPCGSDSDEQEVKSMEIVIRVPGSCGELIQGVLSDGPFLITCPIDCYAAVRISDRFTGWYGMGSKAKSAMKRTLVLLGEKEFPWGIRLESELPQGKGMSSSSADIAATAVGVAQALGYELSAADILREAAAIEPTDGIFCEGIVRMNSMTGTLLAQYPVLPSVRLSVLIRAVRSIRWRFMPVRSRIFRIRSASRKLWRFLSAAAALRMQP